MSSGVSELRAAWVLVVMAGTACSLGTLETTPCDTNSDCRASFGFNAVCAEDGLCRIEEAAPRCDRTQPADLYQHPDKYEGAIVIGNLMDRSEPKKIARERAAQLAAMQVEEVGGLGGRTLAMVLCTIEENHEGDGLELGEAATSTARYLADVVGVPAIVGPSSSENTLAVFEELRGTDTLLISPAATSATLTTADPEDVSDESPGLLWRTAPSDALQGPVIAQDMLDRGVTSVAAIIQEGAYGDDLFALFRDALDDPSIVDLYAYAADFERDDAITQVGLTDVDEVLFISSESNDITAFLNIAATDGGFMSKGLFLTDAGASVDVVGSAASSLFSRLRGTRPKPLDASTEAVYKTFINSYQSAFGDDVTQFSFTAHAYDAAWLVFYGSAWAHLNEEGAVHGTSIARGLRRVSQGPPTLDVKATTWLDVLDRFSTGDSVDLNGSSGELDFDPVTEETSGEIEVWVVSETMNGVEIVPAP